MSLLEITVQPTGTETHHVQTVQLDGRPWQLTTYTNGVDGGWHLDVESDSGDVVRGLGLASGVDLLYPYRHLDMPEGPLWVHDKGLDGADPGLEDFAAGRAALYYLEVGS